MGEQTVTVPTWSPPPWANTVVRVLLSTPGLERVLGKAIAVVTITGRRTGNKMQIPVRYKRDGDTIVFLTKAFRQWWRNLDTNPEVDIRVAGEDLRVNARVHVDDDVARATVIDFVAHSPRDAKPYGIRLDRDGNPEDQDVRDVLPHVVVIRAELS